jgi:hypothetical protein
MGFLPFGLGEQLAQHVLGQVDQPGAAPPLGEHYRASARSAPVHNGVDVHRVHAAAVEGKDGQEFDQLGDDVG